VFLALVSDAGSLADDEALRGPLFLDAGRLHVGGFDAHVLAEFDIAELKRHHLDFKHHLGMAFNGAALKVKDARLLPAARRRAMGRLDRTGSRIDDVAALLGIDIAHVRPPFADFVDVLRGRATMIDNLHGRRRRQAMLFLSFLAGVGLSVYDHYEVSRLRDEIREGTSIIYARLDKQANVVAINAVNIELLKNATLLVAGWVVSHEFEELVISDLEGRLLDHEEGIRDFCYGVSALTHDSLSPLLVKPKALKSTLEVLSTSAGQHNMQILEHNPFRYRVTHVTDGTMLHLMIHVPLVDPSAAYTLYKFVSLPSPVGNGSLFMAVDPPESFLAVRGGDDVRGHVLTHQELGQCREVRFLNSHLCPARENWRNVFLNTCLGALYAKKPSLVRDLCPTVFSRGFSRLLPLGGNKTLVVATREEPAEISCKDRTYNDKVTLSVASVVVISPGCKVVLPLTEIYFSAGVDLTRVGLRADQMMDLNLTWGLLPEDHRDDVMSHLVEDVRRVTGEELQQLRQANDGVHAHKHTRVVFGTWSSVITGSLLFAFGLYLVTYLHFRKKRLSKKKPPVEIEG
jgi:hypothetical protein